MTNPDNTVFPKAYKHCFWVKILKFFDVDPGWKKFGSGINIPDPRHYLGGLKENIFFDMDPC